MARAHPLGVETVAQVEADRERVVADPPSSHRSTRRRRARVATAAGAELVGVRTGAHRAAGAPPTPRVGAQERNATAAGRRVARAARSTIPQSKKMRVAERIRDDDPDGLRRHAPVRPGSASARERRATRRRARAAAAPRPASRMPASPRRRDVQPGGRAGTRARGAACRRARRPARDPRRRARPGRRRARPEPGVVDPVEPRHRRRPPPDAARREELRRGERLVQHHRPVRDEHRVGALAQGAAVPGTGR